jgi:hypothetical protein
MESKKAAGFYWRFQQLQLHLLAGDLLQQNLLPVLTEQQQSLNLQVQAKLVYY